MSDLPLARTWVAGPLDAAVKAGIERLRRLEDVQRIAVMPDVHLAHDVCIGVVLATERLIYPAAVGGDIGCGMLAMAFDGCADSLSDPAIAARILRGLYDAIPARRHNRERARQLPDDLLNQPLSVPALTALARSEGILQLGTLGSGNHFVELQAAEDDRLWLMIHSGSRAVGPAIRDHHIAQAGGRPLAAIDSSTDGGQAYLRDVAWARAYARENRRRMGDAVAKVLADVLAVRPLPDSLVDCDHNHVQVEEYCGQRLLIHRKGAMAASEAAAGILPGSMGTPSFHVRGRGCGEALCSSAHGAGRALGRDQARRSIRPADLRRQMKGVWFDTRLAGRLCEEAPAAYKDIRRVLRAQRDLVALTRTLRPLLNYKGP